MTGENRTIKVVFFGDIVGKPGRFAVRDFLAENSSKYDFVIANVENASHGFGLTEKNYNEFKEYGIHCMTCGNHIWDKKDVYTYIDTSDCLIRPINYPKGTKGAGSKIYEVGGCKIGVINVLGRVFMNLIDSQWEIVAEEIKRIKEITPIIIIDFHAEATAEKICFGKYCAELGVSAFFGTHTHVQTADEIILGEHTAYITDAGMTGAEISILGVDIKPALDRLRFRHPVKFTESANPCFINGVIITFNEKLGKSTKIERIIVR